MDASPARTRVADDVLDVLREAVVTVLELPGQSVTRATRFVEDLRADSLALVEIVEILEERLPGLRVDDADLDDITTIGEAVDYTLARL